MEGKIQIVTVVRDFDLYDETVRKNRFMNRHHLHLYDNRRENIGIPARYNDFIRNHMERGSWLIFCHQDFGFLEDPWSKLQELGKECIYGPVGATRKFGFFVRHFQVSMTKKILLGQIKQAGPNNNFFKVGKFLSRPRIVDTVDCCCIIVHESLIRNYELGFDENLDFHLYSEDLSISARHAYGIRTKAVQFDCLHRSCFYDPPQGFHDSVRYLKSKYGGRKFFGTCND